MTTRKELLTVAKTLGIKGRYDMKTPELQARVNQVQAKTKGRVVRKGVNLSGNQPFVEKLYYAAGKIDETKLAQEPKQVQSLVRFISAHRSERHTGGDWVAKARKAGAVKTKIKDPRELFGYYAKRLLSHGVGFKYAS